jgi:hypothetical protein
MFIGRAAMSRPKQSQFSFPVSSGRVKTIRA